MGGCQYAGEDECWRDTEDDRFNIPMTVEGISEWEDMEFYNKGSFWKWYFGDIDAPVFNDYMSAIEWFHSK